MELISKEMQPVAGTEGAYYRRRRMMRQLPIYDQDPSHCRGLSEDEVKLMEDFVKQYKSEALGVGEVALPGQGGTTKDEGKQHDKNVPTNKEAASTNGTLANAAKEQGYVSIYRLLESEHCSESGWGSFIPKIVRLGLGLFTVETKIF